MKKLKILLIGVIIGLLFLMVGFMRPGTSRWITPDDDLDAAYNWLSSSDRDGFMGDATANNRRTLVLTPGSYSGNLTIDVNYVDVAELIPGSTYISGTVTDSATDAYYYVDDIINVNDGNVGIGITDPNSVLDVNDGSIALHEISEPDAPDTGTVRIYVDTTDGQLKAKNSGGTTSAITSF